MKKQILLVFYLCITVILQATVSKTVNVTAGGLYMALTTTELTTVTNLTITGTIDATDFVILRDSMPMLAILDLSESTISAYTGTQGTAYIINGNTIYGANSIPSCAFYNLKMYVSKVSLTSITIPSSVTSISSDAFNECTGLKSINIPSSVTSIGVYAFYGCSGLTSITIPLSVTSIGDDAFAICTGLTSITIPSSIKSIGFEVFLSCSGLTSITIPSSVTSISYEAFNGCTGLTTITIPSSVSSIGESAFGDCTGLKSIIIIPSFVTYISDYAFEYCTGLTSITIPSSVISIGNGVFDGCTGLTSIYSNSTLPINLSSSIDVFSMVNKITCTLYVPVGSKSAYQAANQWKDFTNIVETTTAVPTITNASINLYPNPIKESFQISGLEGMGTMTLLDLNGKTILTKQVIGNESISVGTLPKGLYILKIITNEGTFELKVVKD